MKIVEHMNNLENAIITKKHFRNNNLKMLFKYVDFLNTCIVVYD